MSLHGGLAASPLTRPVISNFHKGLALSVPLHFRDCAVGHLGRSLAGSALERQPIMDFMKAIAASCLSSLFICGDLARATRRSGKVRVGALRA